MKRLINTVDLIFFQDESSGDYGLAHKETYNEGNGDGFNAFWHGIGMFHDVFEHSHEFKHKYFKGDYAMNMGGELAAMGSMWYYIDTLGIRNRFLNDHSRYYPSESMRETTCSDVRQAISDGYSQFGSTLESNVPKQSPVDNGELEYQIREYWKLVQATEFNGNEEDRERADEYRESVTLAKIANLHRYGYRMAERMIPNTTENQDTLSDFIEYWNDFTQRNSAEELMTMYRGITVKIYKEDKSISWTAKLVGSSIPGYKDHAIHNGFHIEDLIMYENFMD